MADIEELGRSYEGFNKSALGQHFRAWLQAQRVTTLAEAEKAKTPEEAFGLTKTTYAYTVVLTYLDTMALGDKLTNHK